MGLAEKESGWKKSRGKPGSIVQSCCLGSLWGQRVHSAASHRTGVATALAKIAMVMVMDY